MDRNRLTRALERIEALPATLSGVTQPIGAWRRDYERSLAAHRRLPEIQIFSIFAAALIQRAMSGETHALRRRAFLEAFGDYRDVTPAHVRRVLREVGHRFPHQGLRTVLEARDVARAADFDWARYFRRAARRYADHFAADPFLAVHGVGPKTRDFALSEFSDRYVALDVHLGRILRRTAFLGMISRAEAEALPDHRLPRGYRLFRDRLIELARQTGWPGAGWSPGALDRVLWHFGREVCGADPKCGQCPVECCAQM